MSIFKNKHRLNNDGTVPLIAKDKPSSIIAEQYKTIRTNIVFANTNNSLRSIMITSDHSAQGKSTVSDNLAVTCAQQGKKVLLVDADMRRPIAHKTFKLDQSVGLSTVLSGMSNVSEAIQITNIYNLSVMTCGPIPPNPSELLSGDKFGNMLKELYSQYDLIILDTPPVNVAADASVITTKADGTVLVIPQDVAEKAGIINAVTQLKKVHSNILGAVMNNVTNKNMDDYYYYK